MPLALLIAAALTPPLPPVVVTRPVERPLIAWIADAATCGGTPVAATVMRRPMVTLGWTAAPPAVPLTLRFRIDADGRPLSIAQVPDPAGAYPNRPAPQDVAPALAASRFAAGAPHAACEITYRLRVTPVAEAPVEDLVAYTLEPDSGVLDAAGWKRIFAAGATCPDEPRPQPLVQVLPDFDTLPATPGARDWAMVGYDTDARGRAKNVQLLYGTHSRALDAAGVKAMKASRFTNGPRTGCRFPYIRRPAILPAPAAPDPAPPAGATCPADPGPWATRPRLVYPPAWNRRSIEGWAILAYDVAPWGEPGNIRVLAAEPAAAFGEQATTVLRSGRRAPSPTGATGCVERIQFRMAVPGLPVSAIATD